MVLRDSAPVAFVSTTDRGRARAFYEGMLGLALVADEQFALVFDLAGTMLRVTAVDRLDPQPFTVLGWRVADAEAAVRELAARGVVFERYAGMEQDELGIWTSPAGARIAWFKDPGGNVLAISSY